MSYLKEMKIKSIFTFAILAYLVFNFGYLLFPSSVMAGIVNSKPVSSKPVSSRSGFNFVAAGDWGCGNAAQETFSMMKKMKPEMYLGLGDYSYEPSMDCWFDIVKEAGPLMKIAVGNHDTEGSLLKDLMNKFGLDKQYYSFNYRNVHFVGLSTELKADEYEDQYQFVSEDLAKTKLNKKIDWIVVFQHRPLYSGSGLDLLDFREPYHHLFEKYHVDLVLAGHAHNYQRSYPIQYNEVRPARPIVTNHDNLEYIDPKGPIFVIVGTGGESVQGVDPKPYLAKVYEGFGFINIEVDGKQLRAEYYTDSGKTIDEFSIIKEKNNFNEFDSEHSIHEAAVYNKY
jgi:hypothetical protein